jgi:hypothetical protein
MITYSSLGGFGSEQLLFEFDELVCRTRGSADDNLNKPFHSSFHSCSEKTRPY